MATLRMRGLVLGAVLLAALPSCGVTVGGGADSSSGSGDPPAEPVSHYPGRGFIVHEWGTDTVVVGSDGSLQRGLHHEEEDLPAFVYDRLSTLNPRGAIEASVEVKMETPVTYFYSDKALTVNASVGFPRGVLTQWYPSAMQFFPHVAETTPGDMSTLADPVLDPSFKFNTPDCQKNYSTIGDGLLDWGAVDVLPRSSAGGPYLVDAPLDKYTWSYARQVDSNPISVLGVPDENEKFLFYRGLGSFDLPVTVAAHGGGQLTLHNGYAEPIGRVFVINVQGTQGAVTVIDGGIPAGGSVDATAPDPNGQPLDNLVAKLATELTRTLAASGLYHDEAEAMINTWKRQWFKTPGIRLLYLIPQSWTDASIPLTIMPEPEEMVRVMMIRTEVLTPEMEGDDVQYAGMFGGDAKGESLAEAHFQALGRFAEPRLRRALAILGNPPSADAYLQSITTADTRGAAGE